MVMIIKQAPELRHWG